MKRIALAAVLLATMGAGDMGVARAQDVGVSIGVGHDHDYGWRHHHRQWREGYAYERGCRVVVKHRINDQGERVTVRRRVCD